MMMNWHTTFNLVALAAAVTGAPCLAAQADHAPSRVYRLTRHEDGRLDVAAPIQVVSISHRRDTANHGVLYLLTDAAPGPVAIRFETLAEASFFATEFVSAAFDFALGDTCFGALKTTGFPMCLDLDRIWVRRHGEPAAVTLAEYKEARIPDLYAHARHAELSMGVYQGLEGAARWVFDSIGGVGRFDESSPTPIPVPAPPADPVFDAGYDFGQRQVADSVMLVSGSRPRMQPGCTREFSPPQLAPQDAQTWLAGCLSGRLDGLQAWGAL